MWGGTRKGQGSAGLTRVYPGAWTLSVLSCGHKMAPLACLLRFVPLKPWRLSSLCWHSRVPALSRWRCWLMSPSSVGPGLGALGLSQPPLQPGLLGPRRVRWPFLGSRLFRSVSGLGCRGSAAVAIVAPSLAQCPCEMLQLPPPCTCPGLGEAPDPRARNQYLEDLG